LSREGYVNLLLSGGKRPKIQGDTKEMLQARRRFLEAGHYAPLTQAVNETVAKWLTGQTAITVADAGCGEGYYLGQLQRTWPDETSYFFGVDVSKTAVQMAAKHYPNAQFVVADVWQRLPFSNASIGALLNLFAPRNPAEFARVLAPNGILLIVIPQPHHLQQLRDRLELLDIEAEKQQKVVAQLADKFALQAIQPITFEMKLDKPALADLVQMTPNYWHVNTAVQKQLSELAYERLTAACDMVLLVRR
jgi:23S rRNA (guanine745-N1)-methyltransferase